MTEMEKMKAGMEYSYADAELEARKTQAILWCEEYNAIDGRDFEAQYAYLKKMLGSVGERVWIAKTFCCDCGKNIHIGNDFTGNFNLTILDIREVYIGNHVMIGPNTLITTVGHPLSPKARRGYMAHAEPVRIGNDARNQRGQGSRKRKSLLPSAKRENHRHRRRKNRLCQRVGAPPQI